MSPDPTRRSPRSERAILDAALALMNEAGLPALSVEAVAARAGVGKQTIYRWWPSKGAVAIDALLDAADPHIGFPDTGDLETDLAAVLDQVAGLLSHPRLGRHFVACLCESYRDPDLSARFNEKVFAPVRGANRARLQREQKAGTLREDVDIDDVLDLAFGAIWLRALTQPEMLKPGIGTRLAALVLGGAAPRS